MCPTQSHLLHPSSRHSTACPSPRVSLSFCRSILASRPILSRCRFERLRACVGAGQTVELAQRRAGMGRMAKLPVSDSAYRKPSSTARLVRVQYQRALIPQHLVLLPPSRPGSATSGQRRERWQPQHWTDGCCRNFSRSPSLALQVWVRYHTGMLRKVCLEVSRLG
jgi:hypothetical protein